jgi:hypothetical protein
MFSSVWYYQDIFRITVKQLKKQGVYTMDEDLKHNLTAGETWLRGLYILLFAFFLFISRIVTAAVVVIQFLFTVFTGQANENLRIFGLSLSRYIYQCLLFLTYNSDTKPFPFEDWPDSKLLAEKGAEKSGEKTTAKTAKATPRKKARTKSKSTTKKTAKSKSKAKPESEPQAESEVTPETDTNSGPETPTTDSDTTKES